MAKEDDVSPAHAHINVSRRLFVSSPDKFMKVLFEDLNYQNEYGLATIHKNNKLKVVSETLICRSIFHLIAASKPQAKISNNVTEFKPFSRQELWISRIMNSHEVSECEFRWYTSWHHRWDSWRFSPMLFPWGTSVWFTTVKGFTIYNC